MEEESEKHAIVFDDGDNIIGNEACMLVEGKVRFIRQNFNRMNKLEN